MTIRLRRYLPNFVDYREPLPEVGVATTAEALLVPWVASWNDDNLLRFSVSDGTHLMAEQKDDTFWVVARILSGTLDLPVWRDHGRPV